VRHGHQRRKSTLLKLVAGNPARRRYGGDGGQREDGLFRAALHGCSGRRTHGVPIAGGLVSAGRAGLPARAGRLLRVFRRRGGEEMPGSVGRREGTAGHGEDALRPAEPPGAGRAHQPPGHGDQGDAPRGVVAIRGHHAVRLTRPPLSGRIVQSGAGTDARGHSPIRRAATPSTWRAPARLPACAVESEARRARAPG
jgi:hypothetical protein